MICKLQEHSKSWLTPDLCEKLYKRIKENHYLEFDEPLPAFSTRFPGRLESILGSVEQSFNGEYLNSTILQAVVAYFYQIAVGHALYNGNKRMAVLFTHAFLMRNGLTFIVLHNDLYKTAIETVELSMEISSDKIKAELFDYFSNVIVELSADEINLLQEADSP